MSSMLSHGRRCPQCGERAELIAHKYITVRHGRREAQELVGVRKKCANGHEWFVKYAEPSLLDEIKE